MEIASSAHCKQRIFSLQVLLPEAFNHAILAHIKLANINHIVFPLEENQLTAEDAIKFIHGNKWRGSKPGLSRTRELLSKMGNPQKTLQFVHIAGTNGKGSVSAMLSNILRIAGYTTGLYTSPFIMNFNERMQVNGMPIRDEELADITASCAHLAISMKNSPTEFELITAIAMEYFKRNHCDVVVLEAGMGGELDSTNVIEAPLCSVITNIGLDHTKELGDTVEKIASEKAGIIKPGIPAIIYGLSESVTEVIKKRSIELSSPLTIANFDKIVPISDSRKRQIFSYKSHSKLSLPLLGTHQLHNAAVVLETVEVLRGCGLEISESAVYGGLETTVWPARFEIISENPFFVVDGGHNPQCTEAVVDNLKKYFTGMKAIFIFGVLEDKNYMGMAEILNTVADAFVTISPPNPRALSADELAKRLKCFEKPVFPCDSINGGIEKAISLSNENTIVCAVGSLYTAGQVRAYFGK